MFLASQRCAWLCFIMIVLSLLVGSAAADVALPTIFSDHMVLQQAQKVPVWGWAEPNERISVRFANQVVATTTDQDGKWRVTLAPLAVNDKPQTLKVVGNSTVEVHDVLVGEVWLCSGQSNMQWPIQQAWNGDLAIASAKLPVIRHTTIANMGLQVANEDYQGEWQVCSPDTIKEFSAVGYFFGRNLAYALDVPIGLIDNAWGGSACEAWVRRDLLAADRQYDSLLGEWEKMEAKPELRDAYQTYEKRFSDWMQAEIAAKKAKQSIPEMPSGDQQNGLLTQNRPGNLYNGRLAPVMPYAIRGAIWYQGESNATRAAQYRKLFRLMIKNWRDAWGQGDFPFYWVQLADFYQERSEPADSDWAELREAQTMTLDVLPNTGQAVIIDIGEAADIHPRDKEEVANRLSRWCAG